MTLALLAARVALAAVFATAGLAKLADRDGSRRAVAAFGVPARLAPLLGVLLPLVELATAGALLSDRAAGYGALAALLLLLAFTGAIALALRRGRAPECRCFGQVHSARVSWRTVARNAGLATLPVVVLAAGEGAALPPVETVGIAAVILVASLALMWRARRAGGEASLGAWAEGLPVGDAAPEFRLPALEGGTVTLAALRERGRPVLLLFTDAHCGPCTALAPDVARWQRAHAETVTIAVIERGRERSWSGPDEHGRADVLLQEDDEVAQAYRAEGTPSAVLVDVGGRIAGEVAAGAPAIRRLVGQPADVEPAASSEHLRTLERREFLLRLAGTAAAASVALAWPARALAAATRPGRSTACGPGRKPCGTGCCGPNQRCILRAFRKPRCVCNDPVFRDPCPDGCKNTTIDDENCGRCGVECLPGWLCVGGNCRRKNEAQCPGGCPGEGADLLDGRDWCCQGQCKDLANDPDNCGTCGRPCTAGKKPTCCEGLCRDTQSDPRHCGGCFKPCPTEAICHAGKCRTACPKGLKPCGRTCYSERAEVCCNRRPRARDEGWEICNGRCVNTHDSKDNCGGCNSSCTDRGFGETCCSGNCYPTKTDLRNCGGCGRCCPEGCGCFNGECAPVSTNPAHTAEYCKTNAGVDC